MSREELEKAARKEARKTWLLLIGGLLLLALIFAFIQVEISSISH